MINDVKGVMFNNYPNQARKSGWDYQDLFVSFRGMDKNAEKK